ncbi:MAG: Crp/Fnr family transcriptional regulator [Rhodovulum sp.]|nr:Crp/Fnr family transcriptional regulator [Rhodovulum sp.]
MTITKGCRYEEPMVTRDFRASGGPVPSRLERACANGVLAALSADARARLAPWLRDRPYREGHVLWERGERPERIYFPISGMISLVVPVKPGVALEVGNVGREGAVGFHDGSAELPAFAQAVMRVGGIVAHVPVREFAAAGRIDEELRRVEAMCRGWLLAQAQQSAVCNAVHSADARFSRWLSRVADATRSDVVPVTQEVAAEMLGLRRTTVTLIAQSLQTAGIIRYRRGVITIVDREALRGTACTCGHQLGRARWPSELLKEAAAPASNSSARTNGASTQGASTPGVSTHDVSINGAASNGAATSSAAPGDPH